MLKFRTLINKRFGFYVPKYNFSELREWFFSLDTKGVLYMEETEPKIYPNALKDEKFLKIFYKNLERNDTGRYKQYGWMSKCWGEYNFVRCERNVPIIFQYLDKQDNKNALIYAMIAQQPFDPTKMVSSTEGVIFHAVDHPHCKFGIFSSGLSMQLSDNIEYENGDFYFNWEGKRHKVPVQSDIDNFFNPV